MHRFNRHLDRSIRTRVTVTRIGFGLCAGIMLWPLLACAFAVSALAGGGAVLAMPTLASISSDPLIREFAISASQEAVKPIGNFIAPVVQVPGLTGRISKYTSKNRYRRPNARRKPGDPATRIGYEAEKVPFTIEPFALDHPIPGAHGMSEEDLQFNAMDGITELTDAQSLVQEGEILDIALAAAGAGTDYNFTDDTLDPIPILNHIIKDMMKTAKNGAPIKVLWGATALLRFCENAKVIARYVGGRGSRSKTGASVAVPTLDDISLLLFSNPACAAGFYVEDESPEGVAEDIQFMLDEEILVFAGRDKPTRSDPSFMKTLVPMSGKVTTGAYRTQDERDEVLKIDWAALPMVTNETAIARLNAKDS